MLMQALHKSNSNNYSGIGSKMGVSALTDWRIYELDRFMGVMSGFLTDTDSLLTPGMKYDPSEAFRIVEERIVPLLGSQY